jgi:hypothetical protein
MGEYLVEFYYRTDNRTESVVYANNELTALIFALDMLRKSGVEYWCTDLGFSVKISLVKIVK